jgi:hypothetical protein
VTPSRWSEQVAGIVEGARGFETKRANAEADEAKARRRWLTRKPASCRIRTRLHRSDRRIQTEAAIATAEKTILDGQALWRQPRSWRENYGSFGPLSRSPARGQRRARLARPHAQQRLGRTSARDGGIELPVAREEFRRR